MKPAPSCYNPLLCRVGRAPDFLLPKPLWPDEAVSYDYGNLFISSVCDELEATPGRLSCQRLGAVSGWQLRSLDTRVPLTECHSDCSCFCLGHWSPGDRAVENELKCILTLAPLAALSHLIGDLWRTGSSWRFLLLKKSIPKNGLEVKRVFIHSIARVKKEVMWKIQGDFVWG